MFKWLIFRANDEIEKIKSSTAGEIAKLQAALKKSELKITSLEQTVEQKVSAGSKYFIICDAPEMKLPDSETRRHG